MPLNRCWLNDQKFRNSQTALLFLMPVSIDTANSFSVDKISLAERNIVVTGAASEIGGAVSLAAARSGASVMLLDRKQRDLIPIYDQICESGYPEPIMVEIDLRRVQPEGFVALADSLSRTCAQIHGLVHCAMWGAPLTPVAHSDMPVWQKILDQQLIRPMYLTRSLYPLLKHDDPVSIIFSVLASGRSGSAYWGATGAAFAGIENLSQTLSHEWENRNIRINTLDCGKVKTALRKQFYPGEDIGQLRDPDDYEIIRHYLYLLSDHSEHITASQLVVPPLIPTGS